MTHPGPGVFVEEGRPAEFGVRRLAAGRVQVRLPELGPDSLRRRWTGEHTRTVFFGLAPGGPVCTPTEVSDWSAFEETFGRTSGNEYLAYAVYGFFANGGTSCVVVPVGGPDLVSPAGFAELVADQEGLQRWFDSNDVGLVCVPDLTAAHAAGLVTEDCVTAFHNWVVALCEWTGAVALIDPPPRLTPTEVKDWRNTVGSVDSASAVMYYPWVVVRDWVTSSLRDVPPSGHVAGVYAWNDRVRGFHTSPGNTTVKFAENVAHPLGWVDQEHLLAPLGINSLVLSPGRGVVVWGARSLSSDPDWRDVRRRRLLSFIVRRIRAETRWAVFERPDAESVRQDVATEVCELLHLLWRSGALWGTSVEDAYSVSVGAYDGAARTFALDCVIAVEPEVSLPFQVVYRYE